MPNILGPLSKEIITLILVASFIGWPVAWYLMAQWLSSFAYHIDMNALVYALAAVMLALLTSASKRSTPRSKTVQQPALRIVVWLFLTVSSVAK